MKDVSIACRCVKLLQQRLGWVFAWFKSGFRTKEQK